MDKFDQTALNRARYFAQFAHEGQTRRYTGEPYFVHPAAVAAAVSLLTDDVDVIIAAYLHDTVEDTFVTNADIHRHFGRRVASIVRELTDVFTTAAYPKTNRAARKKLEADRLARVSDDAKLVKRADIADNTESIVEHDADFAFVYLAEKAYLLRAMAGE